MTHPRRVHHHVFVNDVASSFASIIVFFLSTFMNCIMSISVVISGGIVLHLFHCPYTILFLRALMQATTLL
jgi:hypothetical protein